jgi:hypothetical protein
MIGFYDLKLDDVLQKMHNENLSYNEAVDKLDEEKWMEERTRKVNEASSDEYDRIAREDFEAGLRDLEEREYDW